MPSKPSKQNVSSNKKYLILMSVIVIVVVGWSGAWVFGRSLLSDQIEHHMAQLSASGLTLDCAELGIAGYPFRYEVSCREMRAQDRFGAEGNVGTLNAVALVYNPFHVILEADAPAAIAVPVTGFAGTLSWDTARASVKYSKTALGNVDMVFTRPEVSIQDIYSAGVASSEKTEIHLQKSPGLPDGIDGFVSVDALKLENLPGLTEPLDVRIHVRLKGGAPLLSGASLPLLVLMNDGQLPVQLVFSEIKSGNSRLGARGDLVVNGNGMLSGDIKLTLSNPDEALETLKPLLPPQNNAIAVAEGLFKSLKPTGSDSQGNPAIELPLVIDQGVMRIGFVTLGQIPPLFQAGI